MTTYDVIVVKKDSGEEIRGRMKDDGLASLYAVQPHDGGEVRYVTVLDIFTKKVEVCDEHNMELSWYDDGTPESGPGEMYQECPQCRRDREPTCPQCGAHPDEGYEVTSKYTRQYGGGYDTYYNCTRCGFQDVAT